jgi:hypothetical protein
VIALIIAAAFVGLGVLLVLGLCMAAGDTDRVDEALELAPARRRVGVASPNGRNGRGSRSPRRALPNRSRGKNIVHHLGKDRLPE